MATVYELIRELRREHPTPSASKTLDMVVAELGETDDNLRQALLRLDRKPVPTGGRAVLEQLVERARAGGVDDLQRVSGTARAVTYEPVDESTAGIAVLLAVSALVSVGLAAAAVIAGLNSILHFL